MSTMPNPQLANSIEGFWTVVFSAGPNSNGGVAAFKDGNVYGGDNAFFYVGTYHVVGNSVTAQLDCKAFARNAINIFGTQIDAFSLNITGTIQSDGSVAAVGKVPIAPHLSISMRMTKRLQI